MIIDLKTTADGLIVATFSNGQGLIYDKMTPDEARRVATAFAVAASHANDRDEIVQRVAL